MEEPPTGYLRRAADVARAVFARFPERALDEQAGPAYFEGFALSRWLFWSRLVKVVRLLPHEGENCLDFGCGFGMMLPLLKCRFSKVFGVDLMPDLARQYLQLWDQRYGDCHDEIKIAGDLQSLELPRRSVDLILALDVLEHVDALPDLLEEMSHLLRLGGILLVSGPTENRFYKLGRRLVGFSGDYHVRTIYDIRDEMTRFFSVRLVDRVFYPLTLFLIYAGEPRTPS